MAREHYLTRVLTCAPLNGTAASVVSQKGCATHDTELSRSEIVEIKTRLERKQRLLKLTLGIDNKAKHVNLIYKFNQGRTTARFKAEPRAVVEYVRIGREVHRMNMELADRARELRKKDAASTAQRAAAT